MVVGGAGNALSGIMSGKKGLGPRDLGAARSSAGWMLPGHQYHVALKWFGLVV